MFVTLQACEERQADSSNKKTMMPHRDGNRDAGARATLGFQTGANFVVQDAPVFLSAPAGHLRVFHELGRESRNRLQECYLNGSCLLRSISCGAFRKVPFLLRHLWHAVAELMRHHNERCVLSVLREPLPSRQRRKWTHN